MGRRKVLSEWGGAEWGKVVRGREDFILEHRVKK